MRTNRTNRTNRITGFWSLPTLTASDSVSSDQKPRASRTRSAFMAELTLLVHGFWHEVCSLRFAVTRSRGLPRAPLCSFPGFCALRFALFLASGAPDRRERQKPRASCRRSAFMAELTLLVHGFWHEVCSLRLLSRRSRGLLCAPLRLAFLASCTRSARSGSSCTEAMGFYAPRFAPEEQARSRGTFFPEHPERPRF